MYVSVTHTYTIQCLNKHESAIQSAIIHGSGLGNQINIDLLIVFAALMACRVDRGFDGRPHFL